MVLQWWLGRQWTCWNLYLSWKEDYGEWLTNSPSYYFNTLTLQSALWTCHPSHNYQSNPECSQPLGFVALASFLRSFLLHPISVPRPVTRSAVNIRINPIRTHTTPTHCILLKVKGFRIRHAVENCSESAYLSAIRADESADSFAAFSGHGERVGEGTDKNVRWLRVIGQWQSELV